MFLCVHKAFFFLSTQSFFEKKPRVTWLKGSCLGSIAIEKVKYRKENVIMILGVIVQLFESAKDEVYGFF